MSDTSERIASVVADALHESPSGERIEAVTEQVVADVLAIVRDTMLTDAAIAAFAEALLQPEVVEAAARALANSSDDHLGFASGGIARLYEADPDPWNLMSDEDVDGHGYDFPDGVGRNSFRFDARTALTAALVALAGDRTG